MQRKAAEELAVKSGKPDGQVTADIRLLGRVEDVAGAEGSKKRELFEQKFLREMAQLMGAISSVA